MQTIDKIHVLKPIRFTNIRRNEVDHKATKPTAAGPLSPPIRTPHSRRLPSR